VVPRENIRLGDLLIVIAARQIELAAFSFPRAAFGKQHGSPIITEYHQHLGFDGALRTGNIHECTNITLIAEIFLRLNAAIDSLTK